MKIIVLIHCSPSAYNARLAWQCVDQSLQLGHQVDAFFDSDGVEHAQPINALDKGLLDLHQAYHQLDQQYEGVRLLICRAALARRSKQALSAGWQLSSLTTLAESITQADRVLTFSS